MYSLEPLTCQPHTQQLNNLFLCGSEWIWKDIHQIQQWFVSRGGLRLRESVCVWCVLGMAILWKVFSILWRILSFYLYCLKILHLECDHVSLVELKIEVSGTNCGRRRWQMIMSWCVDMRCWEMKKESVEQYIQYCCAVLSRSVVSDSLQPHGLCSPPGSSVHEDSPGKNTGVGCHALL